MLVKLFVVLAMGALVGSVAAAESAVTTIYMVGTDGVIWDVGTVTLEQSAYGLVLTPALSGLPPGAHGFHVHEKPSCNAAEQDGKLVPALAAGGHYDPQGSKKHGTPWGDGHVGDLPALTVLADGSARTPVLAPRLKVEDVRGHALMIHAGGDNHADHPAPLGGGGARLYCGVIW
ncbi:superoxide dismutase [Cu-Zn] SodC [Uliginosibacterium sp. H3]|uniref:Superoxide dismutase [Cu-Zn] SodC n=1 Tax=Uliginosibacterium silvisoli TaxID=3114758 RepID=A0ABU6K4E0_9RHOO|nr:superoxide dismutase [Cu-Zn] SodC [Uliginosibacterium sp. H3]